MSAPIKELLAMTVSTRPEAEAFIKALFDAGLMHHFDDGAVDCLAGNNLCTVEQAEHIEGLVSDVYQAWSDSGADMHNDCPIGHCLHVMGHVTETEEQAA